MKMLLKILMLVLAASASAGSGLPKLDMTGGFYFEQNSMKSWYEAKFFCELNDLKLVSVETRAKASEMQAWAPTQTFYWTSGSDVDRPAGDFIWASGGTIEHNSTLWGEGEPNDYLEISAEAGVIFDSGRGKIYDEPNWIYHFFICEFPAPE